MKTVLVIILIISLVIFLDYFSLSFLENEINYFTDEINSAIDFLKDEDYSKASNSIENISNHWNKKEKVWNMLSDHSEIEDISLELNTALLSFEHNMYDECAICLDNLKLAIEFAGDRYSMHIDNIT